MHRYINISQLLAVNSKIFIYVFHFKGLINNYTFDSIHVAHQKNNLLPQERHSTETAFLYDEHHP